MKKSRNDDCTSLFSYLWCYELPESVPPEKVAILHGIEIISNMRSSGMRLKLKRYMIFGALYDLTDRTYEQKERSWRVSIISRDSAALIYMTFIPHASILRMASTVSVRSQRVVECPRNEARFYMTSFTACVFRRHSIELINTTFTPRFSCSDKTLRVWRVQHPRDLKYSRNVPASV